MDRPLTVNFKWAHSNISRILKSCMKYVKVGDVHMTLRSKIISYSKPGDINLQYTIDTLNMNSNEVQNPRRKLDDVFIRELVGLGYANSEGKSTKPHPYIVWHYSCKLMWKRCRNEASTFTIILFLPCLHTFLVRHPYTSLYTFVILCKSLFII